MTGFFARSKESCPVCENKTWSYFERAYLREHGICWKCDKQKMEEGLMSMVEFEAKEQEAAESL